MILISYGTRPEWIKIEPLIKEMTGVIPFRVLFTGQHLDIAPRSNFNLSINEDGPNRLDNIVKSTLNLDEKILSEVTHVLVQGDTTSAFSLALAAFHRKIKIIHLEAGLRTNDLSNPYPEEFNRQCISRMTDIHFCPTKWNKKNLTIEGCGGKKFVVGNTVLDNLVGVVPEYQNKILVTLHRRENHKTIQNWFEQISMLAKCHPYLDFILPIHPNPNVKKNAKFLKHVQVVDPLPYNKLIDLLSKCRLVISDSGGIQEEASFLNKKVIVCRKTTERIESLGTHSFLCKLPSMLKRIFDKVNQDHKVDLPCPYGDGRASQKIVEILNGGR